MTIERVDYLAPVNQADYAWAILVHEGAGDRAWAGYIPGDSWRYPYTWEEVMQFCIIHDPGAAIRLTAQKLEIEQTHG